MYYEEYLPSNSILRRYIKCFWSMQGEFLLKENGIENIFPDACVDLILFPDETLSIREISNNSDTKFRKGLLIGQQSAPFQFYSETSIRMIGIRFYPVGMFPFFNIPMNNFSGHNVDISSFLTKNEIDALTNIARKDEGRNCVTSLESYFLKKLDLNCEENSKIEIIALQLYSKSKNADYSPLTISKLSEISERKLQREFQKRIGVSPRELRSLFRFN
ncbi:DUF6597 domain-containing transcriptional factor, partial [Leptospira stimsonii]|uniref:DUF6597 domain-containing transcriptional factor n=1 Tax=Leptospira stimsonii TaxID=2202203 RepID=UPI003CCFE8E5